MVFACAVQEPSQSALHLVTQSAVVETLVHFVEQWSEQHALHDVSQSVDEVAVEPSGPEVEPDVELHEELHPDLHRESQSVVQLNCGGLFAHVVMQLELQLEEQSTEADALHRELHCCSSLAAHASSHVAGAHLVVHSDFVTTEQCSLGSMSMSPQADTLARAVAGTATTTSAVRRLEALKPWRRWKVFMVRRRLQRVHHDARLGQRVARSPGHALRTHRCRVRSRSPHVRRMRRAPTAHLANARDLIGPPLG